MDDQILGCIKDDFQVYDQLNNSNESPSFITHVIKCSTFQKDKDIGKRGVTVSSHSRDSLLYCN